MTAFWYNPEQMPRRLFTVVEVNRLIPQLESIFTEVLQLHTALRKEEKGLERLGVRPTREIASGHDDGGTTEVRHAKALFRGYYEALVESVGRVSDLGGEVKDLESGLVDFPGRRGNDDILLCWKLGEKSLGHWHAVDAGFAGRRPLDGLVPREPPQVD
jgi:hypothetical protein